MSGFYITVAEHRRRIRTARTASAAWKAKCKYYRGLYNIAVGANLKGRYRIIATKKQIAELTSALERANKNTMTLAKQLNISCTASAAWKAKCKKQREQLLEYAKLDATGMHQKIHQWVELQNFTYDQARQLEAAEKRVAELSALIDERDNEAECLGKTAENLAGRAEAAEKRVQELEEALAVHSPNHHLLEK